MLFRPVLHQLATSPQPQGSFSAPENSTVAKQLKRRRFELRPVWRNQTSATKQAKAPRAGYCHARVWYCSHFSPSRPRYSRTVTSHKQVSERARR